MEIVNVMNRQEFLREVCTLEYDEWASNKDIDRNIRIENKIRKVIEKSNDNDFCKLILIDHDKLIGFISLFPNDSKEREDLSPWYATMYVKKEYRGHGYSKLLNDALLDETRKRKFKEIYLKTELDNYYEKFGAIYVGMLNDTEKLYKYVL